MMKRSYFDEPRPRCEGLCKYLVAVALIASALILPNLRCDTARNYPIIETRRESYIMPKVDENKTNLEDSKEVYALSEK